MIASQIRKGIYSSGLDKYLYSCLLVGGKSRGDVNVKYGDLDLILVFESEFFSYDSFVELKRFILAFRNNIRVAPQIFNKSEFLLLNSPALLVTFLIDGKVIYGNDIKDSIKDYLESIHGTRYFKLSVLSRMYFQRQKLRQALALAVDDPPIIILMAKSLFFILADYLIIKNIFTTDRLVIIREFKKINQSCDLNIIEELVIHYSNFDISRFNKIENYRSVFNFIEKLIDKTSCELLQELGIKKGEIWASIIK